MTTLALVRKLLRDLRWPLLIVMVLMAGFQCLWVKVTQRTVTEISPVFSTLAARAGTNQKAIESVIFAGPGKIAQTLIGGESLHFERAMDVLSIGYVHPLMQVLFCIWAIGRAASAVAGEIDRGTMELLLAQPIRRGSVIAAHLIVDTIVIPLLCLSLWSGTALGCRLVGPFHASTAALAMFPFPVKVDESLLAVDPAAFGPALWNVGSLLFAISGVTMALSAAGRFRNRVIGIAVLISLLQFLINVVGQLWDAADWLRPLTVFFYYQPQLVVLADKWTVNPAAVWGGGPDAINMLAVLFAVGACGYALALLIFTRRDLPAPL
ncbi:MAG TPA: ABC transporter permease subunit [Gemmataceae bacterium]|jgi:ABC-2 type transport system permease protein|nr:ABC transporter permease subunit [Gemmataceae bacterium]